VSLEVDGFIGADLWIVALALDAAKAKQQWTAINEMGAALP
jgi:hypothetical protein